MFFWLKPHQRHRLGMSIFDAYRVGDLGSGLTNQLNIIITELINAEVQYRPMVILGKFRANYNTDSLVPLRDVIDLEDLQRQVGDKLRIYEEDSVQLEFVRAHYGDYADGSDVTSIVAANFWDSRTRSFHILKGTSLNSVLGDPVPGRVKSLFLVFKVGDTLVHLEHGEIITEDIHHAITVVPSKYNRPNLLHEDRYNAYLSTIKFHPSLHQRAQTILDNLSLSPTVNLIHIRNEPDALHFWGAINGIVPYAFGNTLNNLYENLLKQHCDPKDDILVLTSTPDNEVCKYLKNRGYRFHTSEKLEGQREINAIIDLLISRACTGTFIGNVNPDTKRGSTFDNPVWKRLQKGVKCVFIDLDHINEPVQTRVA